MNIAILSFVSEPPQDALGDMVVERLSPRCNLVREVLRADLARLKGLLLAALTDPRFDAIFVLADLPGSGNQILVDQVGETLQPLPSWQTLAAQLLWPHLGSQTLWSHGCMGRSHRRLMGALTGTPTAVGVLLDELILPQLDRLGEWARG